ncbi:tetratricopeptide repeat protein [Orbaceae bacterium ESL0721]|nr:tetratricopeptide repeat protein [Orbaceae bacterium ESL0721]
MKRITIICLQICSLIFSNLAFSNTEKYELTKDYQIQLSNALQGDAIAQFNLGVRYYNGYGVDINYEEAAKWFSLSADQGITMAQFNLGYMYTRGLGVKVDNNRAIYLFLPSANEGNVTAQYNLGVIYYNGEGIKQNYLKSLKWFTLAAIKKDQNSLFMLGFMYQEGLGVEKDRYAAKQFYQKSCDYKNSEACKRFWDLEEEDIQQFWSSKD